jgi:hypothetical protein
MLEKLVEVLENISSRRTFIGRFSGQVTALIAGILGFTRPAGAKTCNCGTQVGGCCLCSQSDSNCQNKCRNTPGTAFWCWVGYVNGQAWSCFECFNSTTGCGGNCPCTNLLCSQATQFATCPSGSCV